MSIKESSIFLCTLLTDLVHIFILLCCSVQNCTCTYILVAGELQTVLCAAYSTTGDHLYSGMLNGDIYKWKEHTILSVIRGAHAVRGYSVCVYIIAQDAEKLLSKKLHGC